MDHLKLSDAQVHKRYHIDPDHTVELAPFVHPEDIRALGTSLPARTAIQDELEAIHVDLGCAPSYPLNPPLLPISS